MDLNWFKKIVKDYPKFWETYLSYFDENQSKEQRFVVFDCETTGLDYKKDRILSIGAVAIQNNQIIVGDFMEIFLQQDIFNPETVTLHGILKEGKEEKIVEAEAVIRFLDFIKDATLVGHHVDFDIEMINQALDRLNVGTLKNQVMDTDVMYQKLKNLSEEEKTSLDDLCEIYKIKKSDRHTASGDAFITALVFLKLKKKLAI
ncbi:3'-5' exonuclease [Flavobacterium sp. HXWNR69]|uniref:3'-5' exonuclease n=1 Tax=Flavobacterium fragile TaxID=2949085 RepID=A0ABT0TGX5_9FLAO|nr:3'-5' exonuclease [Flavobacterium sp. HXWNR69]MCL9770214.1 3'-5' exonuclease [Flavobacterium sp. HXWNR69]